MEKIFKRTQFRFFAHHQKSSLKKRVSNQLSFAMATITFSSQNKVSTVFDDTWCYTTKIVLEDGVSFECKTGNAVSGFKIYTYVL